jgi:hypothetical protein
MKRLLTAVLFSLCIAGFAAPKKTVIKCPAASKLKTIKGCPLTGCGTVDPHLNEQKNIQTDDQQPVSKTLEDLKNLPDPVDGFKIGDTREKLQELGEGQKITVVAYALVARKGGKESCNCKLSAAKDTDNHIVLVDEETLALKAKATPAKKATATRKAVPAKTTAQNNMHLRESKSITAEFTPRVRLDHPDLAGTKLQRLITAAPGHALLVRITGLLMFDSEHSLERHLNRVNNWEIHPVMKLEFCPNGETCTATSNNWQNMEEQEESSTRRPQARS